jgi:hypothetical protein
VIRQVHMRQGYTETPQTRTKPSVPIRYPIEGLTSDHKAERMLVLLINDLQFTSGPAQGAAVHMNGLPGDARNNAAHEISSAV